MRVLNNHLRNVALLLTGLVLPLGTINSDFSPANAESKDCKTKTNLTEHNATSESPELKASQATAELIAKQRESKLHVTKSGLKDFPRTYYFIRSLLKDQGETGFNLEEANISISLLRLEIARDLAKKQISDKTAESVITLSPQQFTKFLLDKGYYFEYDCIKSEDSNYHFGGFRLNQVSSAGSKFNFKSALNKCIRALEGQGFDCPDEMLQTKCFLISRVFIYQAGEHSERLGTLIESQSANAILLDPKGIDRVAKYLDKGQSSDLYSATVFNELAHARNSLVFPTQDATAKCEVSVCGKKLEAIWQELNEASSDLSTLLSLKAESRKHQALYLSQGLIGIGGTYDLSANIVREVAAEVFGNEYDDLMNLKTQLNLEDSKDYEKFLKACSVTIEAHPEFLKRLIKEYVSCLSSLKG